MVPTRVPGVYGKTLREYPWAGNSGKASRINLPLGGGKGKMLWGGDAERETKEPMYTACLREQQGISLAEVEVFYQELVRIGAEWDHTVKPLDCEPKGFNWQESHALFLNWGRRVQDGVSGRSVTGVQVRSRDSTDRKWQKLLLRGHHENKNGWIPQRQQERELQPLVTHEICEAKKFKTTAWLKYSDARWDFWQSSSRYYLDLSPSFLMWSLYFSFASHQPHGPSEFCQRLCGLSLHSCFFFLFPFLYLLWFSHHTFFSSLLSLETKEWRSCLGFV